MMARRLALAPPAAADAASGTALDALAMVLAPRVAKLLQADHNGAEFVDVLRAVPGSKRRVMRACRTGEIAGAAKVARRWLAPRTSIDGWLRLQGPRLVPPSTDSDEELEDLRSRLARSSTPRRSRSRRTT